MNLKSYEIMNQVTHNINYEGIEFEVFGEYSAPEEETGYKGGWSSELIKINDIDIYWMLKPKVIERINSIVVEENY